MDKLAVIKIGSRQYTVREGEIIDVERQAKPLKYSVLMYTDGSKVMVGDSEVKDVEVKMTFEADKREKKIMVGRFKSKSRYRKKRGHRQSLSVLRIKSIGIKGEEKAVEEVKVEKPAKKENTVKMEKPIKATKIASVKTAVKKLPKKEAKAKK